MCGFVGTIKTDKLSDDVIVNMANRIKHRGPDDEAYFKDDKVMMGFRRLSIIDLAHGKQPMENNEETTVLTFNGEIYNFKEVRKDLEALDYVFKTNVDSEVLLHGYDAWGSKLLDHLRGMFAFSIYDRKNGKIFAARDHFGMKPFYYYNDGENFMWGSEIKAFLDHPGFKKEFNMKYLPYHLNFEFIPGRETLFKHVFKLLPGEFMTYDIVTKDLKCERYYKFEYDMDPNKQVEESSQEIEKLVDDSVDAHMIADVEVGSFLSSGVDSSYVLNEASKLKDIQSFSLGFDDPRYSELAWSTKFAEKINQKNTQIKITEADYFSSLPTVLYYMDEPLSNPSAIQLYFLAKSTSKHVKVALSGEGADEFFGGYNTYLEGDTFHKYQKYVPGFVRSALAAAVKPLPRFHGRKFLIRGAQPISERYYRVNYVYNEDERAKLLKDKSLNVDTGLMTKHLFDEVSDLDEKSQMQYFDINAWLPYDILHKADRMSMANSLEVRMPLVDREIAKYARTLPVSNRFSGAETKYAFRLAAKNNVPSDVAKKEKMGFPSPLATWMKEDKYYDLIKGAFTSEVAQRFFNSDYLVEILDKHRAGQSSMQKLFTIYSFLIWYAVYFKEDVPEGFLESITVPVPAMNKVG